MSEEELNLSAELDDDNAVWDKRFKWNAFVYILIYAILGAVSGITNNTMMSYMDIVVPDVVKGINIYSAISSLIVAVLLIYVHKFGYKKILLLSPIFTIPALLITAFINNNTIIAISYVIIVAGVTSYDFMYPLMYTSYVPRKQRTKMMSAVMVVNLIVQTIMIFFGGKIVVGLFSMFQHISYSKASVLSSDSNTMSAAMLHNYTNAYRCIVALAAVFMCIAFFAAFLLREKPTDYTEEESEDNKKLFDFKPLANKYVIWWIVFLELTQIGLLLVVPYFPIYLNDFLHIQRGTVSTIISLQTFATALGYLFAPWLEKKMGSVVSNSVITMLCIPMLLLMANGTIFGSSIVIAIGIIFFLRSGFANATMPIQNSFQMMLVSKDLRPAFSSLITIANAVIGILVGLFTQYILLTHNSGYAIAYYITAGFYLVACIMLLVVFTKKFNRVMEGKNEKNMKANMEKEEKVEEDID